MKKLLNKVGLYTKDQYKRLIESHTTLIKTYQDIINSQKRELEELPYDFDKLLPLYNEAQINSFMYKIINFTRNDKDKKHLLDRWISRLTNAKATLKN